MKKYLIVKCEELNDQWECDANRDPLCVIYEDKIPNKYKQYGYEIYEIFDNGSLALRQEYDQY